MNRNFSPNPYGNPYGDFGFRPPMVGGGSPFNPAPPPSRQFTPRFGGPPPGQFGPRTPNRSPFYQSPALDGPVGYFSGPPPDNHQSPYSSSPSRFNNSFESTSTPGFSGASGRGRRGGGRFGNQSSSVTPGSGRGVKRGSGSPGFGDQNSSINVYYSPQMLYDPWARLTPVSVKDVNQSAAQSHY